MAEAPSQEDTGCGHSSRLLAAVLMTRVLSGYAVHDTVLWYAVHDLLEWTIDSLFLIRIHTSINLPPYPSFTPTSVCIAISAPQRKEKLELHTSTVATDTKLERWGPYTRRLYNVYTSKRL